MNLNRNQKLIIHFLGNRGESNTNEVATGTQMSWGGALKNLQILYKKGYINKRRGTNNLYWELKN